MVGFSGVLGAVTVVLGLIFRCAHAQVGTTLAGYKFESNVLEHSKLDLDQKEMERTTDAGLWSEAQRIYAPGKNSRKSTSLRTLQKFSTEVGEKMNGEGYFQLFKKYFKAGDYGDEFIMGALDGSGEFAGKDEKFRAEIANKGSQYQNVWMYVIHELEDAINDCTNNDLTQNDKGVKAWDEAWAFYTGSLEGVNGSGSGMMIYALAEKRCPAFKTCDAQGRAKVNNDLLALFNQGRARINADKCAEAIGTKNKIVHKMTVPLVQGLLRYVAAAKPPGPEQSKNHAEGLAFARGFLPILDLCNRNTAALVARNFAISANPPMKDSIANVANAVYRELECMGITCADLGQRDNLPRCASSSKLKLVPGTDKPAQTNAGGATNTGSATDVGGSNAGENTSKSKGGISGGAIAGIVIAVLAVLGLGLAAFIFLRLRSAKVSVMQAPPGNATFA